MKDWPDILNETLTEYIERGDQHLTRKDRAAKALLDIEKMLREHERFMFDCLGADRLVRLSFENYPEKRERQRFLMRIGKTLTNDEKRQLSEAYRSERDSRKERIGNAGSQPR